MSFFQARLSGSCRAVLVISILSTLLACTSAQMSPVQTSGFTYPHQTTKKNVSDAMASVGAPFLDEHLCAPELDGPAGLTNSSTMFELMGMTGSNASSNAGPVILDLDRQTLPSFLYGLRLGIIRGDAHERATLGTRTLHGATMLAMNELYNARDPRSYTPMPRITLPGYGGAEVYVYNMNPRGGQRLDMTYEVALYATRALGLWLSYNWQTEATARVYEKEGRGRAPTYRYIGCIGFIEQRMQSEGIVEAGVETATASAGVGVGEAS